MANQPVSTLPGVSPNSTSYADIRTFLRDEIAAIMGRTASEYVESGGIHATAGSMTSAAFATEAFSSSGERLTADGAGGAVAINYATQGAASSDTVWVIISGQTPNTLDNFTRVGSSNYFTDVVSAARPDLPANAAWLMQVTISGSAITAVTDLRNGNPHIGAYSTSDLPAAAIPGRLYRVLDAIGGFRLDTGANLVTFPGGVISITDPTCGAHPSLTAAQNQTRIQALIDACATAGMGVYVPEGVFLTNSLRLKNGLRSFGGPGTLQAGGATAQALIELEGSHFATTPVDDCVIHDVQLDCQEGFVAPALQGIFVSGGNARVTIIRTKIYNCSDAQGAAGIRLRDDCHDCKVLFNHLIGPQGTTPATSDQCDGISTTSVLATAFGGYFTSGLNAADPANTNFNNVVAFNDIDGFTHGIRAGSSYRNVYLGNTLRNQGHRAIIFAGICKQNLIALNQCFDFGSSGIHMVYIAIGNAILGNICRSTVAGVSPGEAAIQGYVGMAGNIIALNDIQAASRYGVYLGVSIQSNQVLCNKIGGYSLAAIALEASWDNAAPPAGALYSRPNTVNVTGTEPTATTWNFDTGSGNVVSGNVIYDGESTSVCAIYLASVNATGVGESIGNTVIRDNDVFAANPDHNLMIYNETAGRVTTVKLRNTTVVNKAAAKFSFTDGDSHFAVKSNNEGLGTGSGRYQFTAADTTPTVTTGYQFDCNSNGSITDFDDAREDQEILIRLDNATTIVHNDAVIRCKGSVNIVGSSSNEFVRFLSRSGVWFEIARSF